MEANQINNKLINLEGKADFIFCMHVLEHIEVDKQIAFLHSVHQALKFGGVILCEVLNAHSPIVAHWRYDDWTHKMLFTTESLRFVLQLSGFSRILVGSTPSTVVVPRSKVKYLFMKSIKKILLFISYSIQRLHLVAELGPTGFEYPLGMAIIGVGYND